MPVDDREWLLAQLNSEQCEIMKTLLRELSSLGIPHGIGLVESLETRIHGVKVAASEETRASVKNLVTPEPTMATEYVRLYNADVGALVRLAEIEPARLIALLLLSHNWPWGDTLLTHVSLVKRRQIKTVLAELKHDLFPGVPPKLAAALIFVVGANIDTATPATVTLPGPLASGWVSRTKLALSRRFRHKTRLSH
jgi:hypothetical protein